MRSRTQAREVVLQSLYQFDLLSQLDAEHLATSLDAFEETLLASDVDSAGRDYARWLLAGILATVPQLDRHIAEVSENWRLQRTAAVDRCVLRIGLFELLESEDVPRKVAISEAIELAKKFSASQSGAFVNGILDRLSNELGASAARGTPLSPSVRREKKKAES